MRQIALTLLIVNIFGPPPRRIAAVDCRPVDSTNACTPGTVNRVEDMSTLSVGAVLIDATSAQRENGTEQRGPLVNFVQKDGTKRLTANPAAIKLLQVNGPAGVPLLIMTTVLKVSGLLTLLVLAQHA